MAFIVDGDSNIEVIQGDSGTYTVNKLPNDRQYTVCFAIQDSKRNFIGSEIDVKASYATTVVFVLTPDLTKQLTVKASEETATYYFGLKICWLDNGVVMHDTLLLGDQEIGDKNTITVYPLKVTGTSDVDPEIQTDTDSDSDTDVDTDTDADTDADADTDTDTDTDADISG